MHRRDAVQQQTASEKDASIKQQQSAEAPTDSSGAAVPKSSREGFSEEKCEAGDGPRMSSEQAVPWR